MGLRSYTSAGKYFRQENDQIIRAFLLFLLSRLLTKPVTPSNPKNLEKKTLLVQLTENERLSPRKPCYLHCRASQRHLQVIKRAGGPVTQPLPSPRRTWMKKKWSPLFAITLMLPLALAQDKQAHNQRFPTSTFHSKVKAGLTKHLSNFVLFTVETPLIALDLQAKRPLYWEIDGKTHEIALQANDLRSQDYFGIYVDENGVEHVEDSPCYTYKGRVVGRENSRVRLLATPERLSGVIWLGEETYFIKPVSDLVPEAAQDLVILYKQDHINSGSEAACGIPTVPLGDQWLRTHKSGSTQFRIVEIATEADSEFSQNHPGQSVNSLILGYLNALEGIWERDLKLRVRLRYQIAWAPMANDPYTDTIYGYGPRRHFGSGIINTCSGNGNAPGLWEQFRGRWNSAMWHVNRDIAVLFTGRDLKLCPTAHAAEAELFGAAGAQDTVCKSPDKAYVIMEKYPINTTGLLAHELGHALGQGGHASLNCNSATAVGSVMCAEVQAGSNYYDPNSITQINNHINAEGDCLDPVLEVAVLEDAFVQQSLPNANFGSSTQLHMRSAHSGQARHTYLKFSVTGITGTISSAKLRVKTGPTDFPSSRIYHMKNNGWQASTLTWNNAPLEFWTQYAIGWMRANSEVEIDVGRIVTGNGVYTFGLVAADMPNLYILSGETSDKPTLVIHYQP